jgi:1-deoxy-D-xylulose-5-phosphate reductoisomerase
VKRVAVLGSTGSIGRQTLDVISQLPNELKVVALAAKANAKVLADQAERFGVESGMTALHDSPDGMARIVELATADSVDIVVVSVAGVIGLIPTIEAIRARKQIALASKEVLVAAGEVVMPLVREHGVTMTPIDSEHSAIFQCLEGVRQDQILELLLTASGGPFRGRTRESLANVTVREALDHPTWSMGGKITIDSATLMNKGLELIEARWLFDIDVERINVVVHPQSIIHSMVKLIDGSVLGQFGWPDMRLPIAYALLYPERLANNLTPWNPVETPQLTFESVDETTFPSIALAREAARLKGTMPTALNAANEEAANSFLAGKVNFLRIPEIVEAAMENHQNQRASLEAILETDAGTRAFVRQLIDK